MFSVSLFFIVLRKLSTRPKPQVSQEREGKNTIKTKSQATSSSPGRAAHCLHASFRRSAPPSPSGKSQSPGCSGGFSKAPLPTLHCRVCTTLCISPKTPLSFPFIWPSPGAAANETERTALSPELEAPWFSPAGHCTEV